MASKSGEIIWNPIPISLQEIMPLVLEQGLPEYAASPLAPGEDRLPEEDVWAVLLAAAYIGALVGLHEQPIYRYTTAWFKNDAPQLTDAERHELMPRIEAQLRGSVHAVSGMREGDVDIALDLADGFVNTKVIYEDKPLDAWVLEIFWPEVVGQGEPAVGSALMTAIRNGLHTRAFNSRTRVVWDDRLL